MKVSAMCILPVFNEQSENLVRGLYAEKGREFILTETIEDEPLHEIVMRVGLEQ
jgi:hypothetical protein